MPAGSCSVAPGENKITVSIIFQTLAFHFANCAQSLARALIDRSDRSSEETILGTYSGSAMSAMLLAVLAVLVTIQSAVAHEHGVISLTDDSFEHATQAASGQTTGYWCAETTLRIYSPISCPFRFSAEYSFLHEHEHFDEILALFIILGAGLSTLAKKTTRVTKDTGLPLRISKRRHSHGCSTPMSMLTRTQS